MKTKAIQLGGAFLLTIALTLGLKAYHQAQKIEQLNTLNAQQARIIKKSLHEFPLTTHRIMREVGSE